MYQAVLSGAFRGLDSFMVQVEVDISEGLPCMDMIGYLANEVKESKERVRVGIKNSGFEMPIKRITISLTPADIRKDGSGFDLPVALGILMASDEREKKKETRHKGEAKQERVSGEDAEADVDEDADMDDADVDMDDADVGVDVDDADTEAEVDDVVDVDDAAADEDEEAAAQTEAEIHRFRKQTLVIGELGLDGEVKPVKGVLPILLKAEKEGVRNCIMPLENMKEAENVKGIRLFPVTKLEQAFEVYRSGKRVDITLNSNGCGWGMVDINYEKDGCNEKLVDIIETSGCNGNVRKTNENGANTEKGELQNQTKVDITTETPDFSQIKGQHQARRAAEIAAAGFHNLLLFGPPGSGKSMIAERIPGILPKMSYEECLEVTQIYSVAGLLDARKGLVTERPYERPHHTITPVALTGGGAYPLPGAITLAHKGVLFLDELPEFGREKLDLLRQPLEEKKIRIIRNQYACDYSCDFMFVAAMNPCPCGFYPDRRRCNCKEHEVQRYLKRVSGPILDRMDISVEVGKVEWAQLQEKSLQESSESIRARVGMAHEIQRNRQGKFNASLSNEELDRFAPMKPEAEHFLAAYFDRKQLSIRGYQRIRKLCRTLADLEQKEVIEKQHVVEAVMLNQGMEGIYRKGAEG
ncbi:MAG: YifB family Mg chelatase-like AAA ATPase [Lachnospiraceae bacterium]|nr:YifB family Mg chelatase-like AAA ATPase [Lachnospiraceae bacterium]